ncbi:conserved hypothetical protein (DUF4249) [Formosa agariphila KMM 3901]|uniref:DUF4249 domain-containing protein n=2 Tax=Formosa TaxID=225842 RepID=T2KKC0_FORAG|nr:conserved hypothetical protein (DUF4249) [Formosa agariphila KMM 3901]
MLNCTEQIELKTEDFQDALVVEATFTNEFKKHEIKLSRTFRLESSDVIVEENADVKILDSKNNEYVFQDTGNGVYVSNLEFQALKDVTYQLIINTTDGTQYVSTEELLPSEASIDNLYPELVNLGDDYGVQIFVDTNNNLGDAQFFRYEYDETYKLIAPYYTGMDSKLINVIEGFDGTIHYDVSIFPNPEMQEICYPTNYSGIILANKDVVTGDQIVSFPIRFTSHNNYSVFKNRYSILVRQYVQSANAYNFYRILKELQGDDSVLLDNQPGFIQGNISSTTNENKKVIGYFDVSTVDSKRIFFNYKDIGIDIPPYIIDCDAQTFDKSETDDDDNQSLQLYNYLSSQYTVYDHPDDSTIYTVAKRNCMDCSVFGTSIKPEFWED